MSRSSRGRQNTDAKRFNGKWLNKRLRKMHIAILKFLKKHNHRHARREKTVSGERPHTRYRTLATMLLEELPALGFEPTCLLKIKLKHIVALLRFWEADGLCSGTMQNKYAILVWVCTILRKTDCLPENPAAVLEDPSRWHVRTVADEEKSPDAKGIDMEEKYAAMAEREPVIAVQVRAQEVFGLRTREAVCLRPHEADRGDHLLLTVGTKGGRPRVVSMYDFKADYDADTHCVVIWDVKENAEKRAHLDLLKSMTRPGRSLIPRDRTLAQWRRKVRYLAERHGLTKRAGGATLHGLRHAYLCRRAEAISDTVRPLRRTGSLTGDDVIRDRVARQIVAIEAGHHDTYTTETYYGPRTERAPRGVVDRIAACMKGPVREPLIRRTADGWLVGGRRRRIRVVAGPPGRGEKIQARPDRAPRSIARPESSRDTLPP